MLKEGHTANRGCEKEKNHGGNDEGVFGFLESGCMIEKYFFGAKRGRL